MIDGLADFRKYSEMTGIRLLLLLLMYHLQPNSVGLSA
jgi:hypothetical protein